MNGLIFNKELAISSVGQQPTQFTIILDTPLVIPPNSEIAWTNLHFNPASLDGNIAGDTFNPTAVIYHSVKGFGDNFGKSVDFATFGAGLGLRHAGVFATEMGAGTTQVIRNQHPIYYKLMNTKPMVITQLSFQLLGYKGQPLVPDGIDLSDIVDLIVNYTFNIRTPGTGFSDFMESLRQRWTDPLIMDDDRKEIDIANSNRTL